jgi:CheY-like chemotaxis protein
MIVQRTICTNGAHWRLSDFISIWQAIPRALEKLRRKKYDLVISDMGRPSSKQAGFELLKAIRDTGNDVPFVIYAGSNAPAHGVEARRRGAQGSTNDPSELFELVLDQILT